MWDNSVSGEKTDKTKSITKKKSELSSCTFHNQIWSQGHLDISDLLSESDLIALDNEKASCRTKNQ
jgi:hypothetical protein